MCAAGSAVECAVACHSARGCQARACLPDVMVSCFSTNEVRALDGDLALVGQPRAVDNGPISLATAGDRIWVAHALAPPSVIGLAAAPGAPALRFPLGGGDLEMVRAAGGLLFVSDVTPQNLVVVDPSVADPAKAVVADVPLARAAGAFENPHGIAQMGSRTFVALNGSSIAPSFTSGQAIAIVNRLPCQAPPCDVVTSYIGLEGVAGAYDLNGGGFPFPSGAVALGNKVLVTLAHLKTDPVFFVVPAGTGRLLVIDTEAGDALSVIDLGAGCTNPSAVTAAGTTAWVSCGGSSAVLPVDFAVDPPVVGAPLAVGVVSGGLAFCNGTGYVTDQYSGSVVRFDPAGVQPNSTVDVCPINPDTHFAFASDVACAP
jgi:hypothetical protein